MVASPNPSSLAFPPTQSIGRDDQGNDIFVTDLWRRFFVNVFTILGQGRNPPPQAIFFKSPSPNVVEAYNSATGAFIGTFLTSGSGGGIVQPVAIVGSPFVYKAHSPGTLVVESGAVSISRDGGATYYACGLTGAAVPVLNGDWVQVIFYNVPPSAAFFPQGGS